MRGKAHGTMHVSPDHADSRPCERLHFLPFTFMGHLPIGKRVHAAPESRVWGDHFVQGALGRRHSACLFAVKARLTLFVAHAYEYGEIHTK